VDSPCDTIAPELSPSLRHRAADMQQAIIDTSSIDSIATFTAQG
jgi:hypothetical protein